LYMQSMYTICRVSLPTPGPLADFIFNHTAWVRAAVLTPRGCPTLTLSYPWAWDFLLSTCSAFLLPATTIYWSLWCPTKATLGKHLIVPSFPLEFNVPNWGFWPEKIHSTPPIEQCPHSPQACLPPALEFKLSKRAIFIQCNKNLTSS
jgi:hypothetical protein